MTFLPVNFQKWIEDDVREEILTPLLHRLGYRKDSENDIRRGNQLILKYPKIVFGTRKSKDKSLRGFADYILEVGGQIRWILEAKSPSNGILDADVGQALTYARHPEVNAVLFCLCDGRELRIYRSTSIPEAALLLSIKYQDFEAKFRLIEDILSPVAINRVWNNFPLITGEPIGYTLGSLAKISGGAFKYDLVNGKTSPFPWNFYLVSGVIERDEEKKLVAVAKTHSPLEEGQLISEKIGTDQLEFFSTDSILSSDKSNPTIFYSNSDFTFPAGTTLQNITYPVDVSYQADTILKGHLETTTFIGTFTSKWVSNYHELNLDLEGTFKISLI